MEEKKYKAKLHIATGPFSYMEVEIEDTMPNIIGKNEWLLAKHAHKTK